MKTAGASSVDRWVTGVAQESKLAKPVPMKRFTIDVPADLHRRIKGPGIVHTSIYVPKGLISEAPGNRPGDKHDHPDVRSSHHGRFLGAVASAGFINRQAY